MASGLDRYKTRIGLWCVILASFLLSFIHENPLYGSVPLLVFISGVHIYVMGWLLVRVLRIKIEPNPILHFAWVVVAGLAFSIAVSGVFRLFEAPIQTYILFAHVLMMVMVFFVPLHLPVVGWRDLVNRPLMYVCLLALCVLGLWIGLERSQLRFDGWEDQTVFISAADWLTYEPNYAIGSRQVGAQVPEYYRWVIDGWTYQHAVWSWSSGISAATLIWHILTPLFSWMPPLLAFAFAYELSRRTDYAFYAACGVSFASVLTLDSLVYIPSAWAYGQNMLAQMNTLRMFSTAIMLPLTLMVGLSFLRSGERAAGVILFLAMLSISFLHSRQIVIVVIVLFLAAILLLAREFNRKQLSRGVIVGIFSIFILMIPFFQRQTLITRVANPVIEVEGVESSSSFITIPEGDIAEDPNAEFVDPLYHPLMYVSFFAGFAVLFFGWRRFENQLLFAITLSVFILFFVPFSLQIAVRVMPLRLVGGFILMLPIGVILGAVFEQLWAYLPLKPVVRFRIGAIAWLALVFVTMFEPIPFSGSGVDQLRAIHDLQSQRGQLAADRQVLDRFNAFVGMLDAPTVILSPNRIDNYVIEAIPYTLISGGRSGENAQIFEQARRFHMRDGGVPFLDAVDLARLQHWDVRYLMFYADDTRVPQMLMMPEQFKYLFDESGYVVFELVTIASDEAFDLFSEMNAQFVDERPARWHKDGFDLFKPGGASWAGMVEAWQALRDAGRDDALVRYGLASALLLAGEDGAALALWQGLVDEYPDAALLRRALSATHRALGDVTAARDVLLGGLASDDAGVRVVSARELLDISLFYVLEPTHIEAVLQVIDGDALAWELLATHDKPDAIRQYAALLLSAGYTQAAQQQMAHLGAVVRPEDVITQAFMAWQGDPQNTLAVLSPYRDFDHYAVAWKVHPDRWETNYAAGLYAVIQGNLAQERGDYRAAIAEYERAVAQGVEIAGYWFMAEAYQSLGDVVAADRAIDEMAALESDDAALWALSARNHLATLRGDAVQVAEAADAFLTYAETLALPVKTPPILRALTQTLGDGAFVKIVECCTLDDVSLTFRGQLIQQSYAAYPENTWQALAFDRETYTRYGEISLSAMPVLGASVEFQFALPVAADTPMSLDNLGVGLQTQYPPLTYRDVYWFE